MLRTLSRNFFHISWATGGKIELFYSANTLNFVYTSGILGIFLMQKILVQELLMIRYQLRSKENKLTAQKINSDNTSRKLIIYNKFACVKMRR